MPAPENSRIRHTTALISPAQLEQELPCPAQTQLLVAKARKNLHHILHGADDRLAVIVGPCSIHDPQAALEYAERLAVLRARLGGELEIVMRAYFAKPRTTVGWKGLINDPHMDGSFDIQHGLRAARRLLLGITALELPIATEYLDLVAPHYISDLVAWAAIGARTTESQVHREFASGLPCPVGFKNGTDGNIGIAVDAILAAAHPHHFFSTDADGRATVTATAGNEDGHLILRGGKTPNYDAQSIDAACAALMRAGQPARLMIDASHANSGKKHENQLPVCAEIGRQIAAGDERIIGVMIESNLVAGRQDIQPGRKPVFGQSITDACIGWNETVEILEDLAEAVAQRRTGRSTENGRTTRAAVPV
ncbi:3-deoxy-D-arabinoheptulosonate-7-phosphate synthase [Formivibrio citricus]|uniref:Phospho-2-dehydro-3-deoxyheptonate aldolase n=1 Tax=Formivibrio citricus TaxID=83765 RepID=A0A1I4YNX0_9NEIS|nr:3-deoxy-7-phosphoheptulonate synthase [Formivibrio citricus]SFN39735.1 3-deoxy-D-arabinoheptulosonate-7-phosphate synthase [Formivibrio citricus]